MIILLCRSIEDKQLKKAIQAILGIYGDAAKGSIERLKASVTA